MFENIIEQNFEIGVGQIFWLKFLISYYRHNIGQIDYVWETHQVETEDGWILTLYRIYGKRNADGSVNEPRLSAENKSKYPILV